MEHSGEAVPDLLSVARASGGLDDPVIGEDPVLERVADQLALPVTDGIRGQELHDSAASMLRLFMATADVRRTTIGIDVAGPRAATWRSSALREGGVFGVNVLFPQGSSRGGRSVEMART